MKTDAEIFANHIDPEIVRHEAVIGMPMAEYQAAPGFSPHLVQKGISDIRRSSGRGCPYKLRSYLLIEQLKAEDKPLPPGVEQKEEKKSDALLFGGVYHALIEDPESVKEHYAVVSADLKAELVALSRERKLAKAPQEYSGRLKEASEFKKKNGRDPDDEEKAFILRQAQDRFLGDLSWHPRLTEFVEWAAQQEAAGKEVVHEDTFKRAEAMVASLWECPLNKPVARFLDSQERNEQFAEVSLFAAWQFKNRDEVIQLKGRPDLLTSQGVLDPKTCRSCYHEDFASDVDNFGYALQAGAYTLYTELLEGEESVKHLSFPLDRFGFLAHESSYPFLAKIYWLPGAWVRWGRARFLETVRATVASATSGDWSNLNDDFQFPDEIEADMVGEELLPRPWTEKLIEHYD